MLHSINHCALMEIISDIYVKCNIQIVPVPCTSIISCYGFRIYTYSELQKQNARIYELAVTYSKDSFTFADIIAYNDNQSKQRVTFSLMHELGHYILDHQEDTPENEDDADEFASHVLAPRILIHKFRCETADDIHDKFGLSYAAANRALASYHNWYREICWRTPRKPLDSECQLERIFFPESMASKRTSGSEMPTHRHTGADVARGMRSLGNWEVPNNLQWFNGGC